MNPLRSVAKIAGTMMLRNESQRIMVTLKSIENVVSGIIVFDTGSTDNTLEIVANWCEEQKVPFHLKQGEFVDFSKSRNELLDFADSVSQEYNFFLLLDCNDELQSGDKFLEECVRFLPFRENAFMIRQKWLTGTYINKYLNTRLIKPKCGWRYKKRVHEYLGPSDGDTNINRPTISEDVILFQNRNDDDDKTLKRFKRDKEFLLADVQQFNDSRDMFYLAQTLSCLNENDEAYNWYQKRAEIVEGFWEERFHSYLRSAEIALVKQHDVDLAIVNYFKAAMIDFRAEPLIALGKIYRDKQDFVLAYTFLKAACELEFPSDNILFVSENDYTYERWQQLSVVAFYVGRYSEGLKALQIAQATGKDLEFHQQNLNFYKDKEGVKDTERFEAEDMPTEISEIHDEFLKEGTQALQDQDTNTAIIKFLNAFQLSHRVSSLLMLSEYCRLVKAFKMSCCIVDLACQLNAPSDITKDVRQDYSYTRWHLMGIVAFYANKIQQGKSACIKALREGINITLDKNNLLEYLKVEDSFVSSNSSNSEPKELKDGKESKESLQKYKDRRVIEMMTANPKISKRQAEARAKLEWKLNSSGKK